MDITIFNYLDYHEFLRDWFGQAKKQCIGVTYQSLADSADIGSKSYLCRVFTGKGKLSHKSAVKIIRLLNLKGDEIIYFNHLISLKHAKSDTEKNSAIKSIDELINPEALELERKKFVYFKDWYHPVIRELVCTTEFNENFQKLGRMIVPNITAGEAHASVRLLMKLNLIEKREQQYTQTGKVLTAEHENDFVALRNYQKQMFDMGLKAMSTFKPSERSIITMTAGVSHIGYQEITDAIQEFQETITDILQRQQEVERACQLNIQLFPLSKDISKRSAL